LTVADHHYSPRSTRHVGSRSCSRSRSRSRAPSRNRGRAVSRVCSGRICPAGPDRQPHPAEQLGSILGSESLFGIDDFWQYRSLLSRPAGPAGPIAQQPQMMLSSLPTASKGLFAANARLRDSTTSCLIHGQPGSEHLRRLPLLVVDLLWLMIGPG